MDALEELKAFKSLGDRIPPEMVEAERSFAAERVDPLWSPPTETRILGKIAEIPGFELGSLQVECRTTLCRVELLEHGAIAATTPYGSLNQMVDTFGLKPRWMISVVNSRGKFTSIAYLERGETGTAANGESGH